MVYIGLPAEILLQVICWIKSFNVAEMRGIWRHQNTKPQVVGALGLSEYHTVGTRTI